MMGTMDAGVAATTGVAQRRGSLSAYRLLRPQVLLLAAVSLMVLFTLVPPALYERAIHEPDLMFANPVLYAFLAACAAMVWLGIRAGQAFAYRVPPRLRAVVRVPAFVYLLLPVVAALALLLLTITTILRNDPMILALALSGEGQQVKDALADASQGTFSGSLPLAMGVAWWAWANYLQLSVRIRRLYRILLVSVVALLVAGLLFLAFLMMSRFVLMPTMFGLFLIYLRHAVLVRGARIGGLMLRGLLAMAFLLFLFGLIALLRTSGTQGAVLASYLGYGPTSVNHLAALLDGRFPLGMLDQYLRQENFGFIYKFPFTARLLDTEQVYATAFQASFRATSVAGLNASYNWFTAWGEVWAGLGWLTPVYLFFYGLLFARAWRGFTAGSISGLLLYPWLGFAVLFTFGFNFGASNFLSVLVLLSIILYVYSGLVRVRTGPPHE